MDSNSSNKPLAAVRVGCFRLFSFRRIGNSFLLISILILVACLFFWHSPTLPYTTWSSKAPLDSPVLKKLTNMVTGHVDAVRPPPPAKTGDAARAVSSASASAAASAAVPALASGCSDVLSMMTRGQWVRKNMTPSDVQKMKAFHKHVREVEHKIPRGLQRTDGRCGNISFDDGDGEHPKWFRAVCDAEGKKPCCYQNKCVDRSPQQCACAECYDMRNPFHAEYATWRPWKKECQLKEMTVEEICRLLKGATLVFIGDSFVRHVFTALLMAVRGNSSTGAFGSGIPAGMKTKCAGIYMFTEKECRLWVDGDVKVCPGGSTHLQLKIVAGNTNIRSHISPLLRKPRSLAFIGVGFHGGLKAKDTFRKVMQPVLEHTKRDRLQWPHLLWATIHHWGTLKSPLLPGQSVMHVRKFNEKMTEFLRPWDVAVLDTFNMTKGLESFDGSHYGYGVNKVKVQILLRFVQELQLRGKW